MKVIPENSIVRRLRYQRFCYLSSIAKIIYRKKTHTDKMLYLGKCTLITDGEV